MRATRRRLLRSLGVLTVTGLAGCAGQSGSTPTATGAPDRTTANRATTDRTTRDGTGTSDRTTERRAWTKNRQSEKAAVATVRRYYEAVEAGDSERINRYTVDALNVTQSEAAGLQETLREYSEWSAQFSEWAGRKAEVFVVLDTTINGRRASTVRRYTLVRRDGEWLIGERRNGL